MLHFLLHGQPLVSHMPSFIFSDLSSKPISTMSFDKKANEPAVPSNDHVEEIRDVEPVDFGKNQADLSSIEATAASKAAWLISTVVSIGGLLFGMYLMQM
jgi:hypothetical protein